LFTRIEVHFIGPNRRRLRAIVKPGGKVKGIVFAKGSGRVAFARKNNLTIKPGVPPGVRVLDQDGKDVTEELRQDLRFGPGVCYPVGVGLICW
jgi:hypothetical protein